MRTGAVFGIGARAVFLAAIAIVPAAAHEIVSQAKEPERPRTHILVEIQHPAKMIGFPAVCPGTSAEDDQSEIVCMAELYEAPVRVLDHLGGKRTKKWLNIRFTAHSFSAVWKKDRRFLLSVVPFEDNGQKGYFAYSWEWENDDGEFCIQEDSIGDTIEPYQKFYEGGRTMITGENNDSWSSGIILRCVKGTPSRSR